MLFPIKIRLALAGLAVAGGAVAATALGPAGPAVGQSSPPIQLQAQVNSPAALIAKGAGADVSVTASCSGFNVESGTVFVSLTERSGSLVAVGSGSATFACTGTAQTVDLIIAPAPNQSGLGGPTVGVAFKKGIAVANTIVQACTVDFFTCNSQQTETAIELGK